MALTTRVHQLALFVIFESYLQMVADAPAHYRNQPGLDFIRLVPASWDETRFISGEIGDYVAIARRSGDDWFVGAITDLDERKLSLPLDFLGDRKFKATTWSDGPDADEDPTQLVRKDFMVDRHDRLKAIMGKSGGFAAHLQAID
jgi:alpha-glucosidase